MRDIRDIKIECQKMYDTIKLSQERLKELRDICPHENTHKGNYSYRIGAIYPVTICEDCGDVIKYD